MLDPVRRNDGVLFWCVPFARWRRCIAALCAVWFAMSARGQEVMRVTWPTTQAAQPVVLAKPAGDILPMFRLALPLLPESKVVSMALSQPGFVGLPAEDCRRLQALVA